VSKLNDLLSKIITKVNSHSTELSQLSADIAEIGTQEEIVQQVINALGTPVFGTVDAEKNIILKANLAEGDYPIGYEDEDGKFVQLGVWEVGGSVTNILPLAVNSDGTLYNGGKGYKEGYRLNSSGAETAQTGMNVTGFMPVKWGEDVYLSGISMLPNNSSTGRYVYVNLYGSDFTSRGRISGNNSAWPSASNSMEMDASGNVTRFTLDSTNFTLMANFEIAYMRLSAQGIDGNSIIATEPIE
jgi:hypothetical protein